MMFEAFGFSRLACVAETYLSYLRALALASWSASSDSSFVTLIL